MSSFQKTARERFWTYAKQSKLLNSAFGSFGLKLTAGGAIFVSGIILARLLGPREYGIYAITMAVITLTGTIATLGLPSLLTREVAQYISEKQWGSLKGIAITMHIWTVIASIFLIIIAIVFINYIATLQSSSMEAMLSVIILVPLVSLNQIRAAVLRGLHWVVLADIPDMFVRPIFFLVAVGIVSTVKGITNSGDALILQAVSFSLAFLIGYWVLFSRFPKQAWQTASDTHNDHWIKEARPFFWITVVVLIDSKVGLYLLGVLSEAKQAGIYEVALQLVALVILGLTAVNAPLQPKLAEAISRNDKEEAQVLLSESARIGTSFAIIAAVILFPFANEIVLLFGSKYNESANILRILVVGQIFNAAAGSCGIALNASGNQRSTMYGVSMALILDIVLCFLLIPKWKATGAAIAAATSIVIWNTFLVNQAYKYTGLRSSIIGTIKIGNSK